MQPWITLLLCGLEEPPCVGGSSTPSLAHGMKSFGRAEPESEAISPTGRIYCYFIPVSKSQWLFLSPFGKSLLTGKFAWNYIYLDFSAVLFSSSYSVGWGGDRAWKGTLAGNTSRSSLRIRTENTTGLPTSKHLTNFGGTKPVGRSPQLLPGSSGLSVCEQTV